MQRPSRRPAAPRPAVAFALASLIVGSLAAQEEADSTYFESIDVRRVNVEVFVTDSEGRPVRDLAADDFRLFEDGREVEVTNFFAMDTGFGLHGFRDEQTTGLGERPLPEEQQLSLVIVVDNATLTTGSRSVALAGLDEFLQSGLGPEDRVLVAVYDGALETLTDLTTDIEAARQALVEISRSVPGGGLQAQEFSEVIREIERAPAMVTGEDAADVAFVEAQARSALSLIRLFTSERATLAARQVAELKEFVRSLSGLAGRKVLIMVSGGISMRPGEALYQAWQNRYFDLETLADERTSGSDIQATDNGHLLAELAREANANRITFYAVGAGGEVPASNTAETGRLETSSLGVRGWNAALESLEASNRADSMIGLAVATGGEASLSAVDPAVVLARMRSDLASYYSLAYEPSGEADGRPRSLEVEVSDRAWKVRHREAHTLKTESELIEDRVRSSLNFRTGENPLRVELEFGRDSEAEDGMYRVPLTVRLPIGRLVLLPQGPVHSGTLSLYFGVRDTKGRSSPIHSTPIPIRIPNEQLMTVLRQQVSYRMELLMRPGKHTVAVVVRDELGSVESVTSGQYVAGGLMMHVGPGGR